MLYTYVRFPLLFSREQYLHRGNRSFSLSCVLRVSLYKSILDLALFLYSASFPGVLENSRVCRTKEITRPAQRNQKHKQPV